MYDDGEDLTANDVPVDWEQVMALQGAYDVVLDIKDDESRLAAAKDLVHQLG